METSKTAIRFNTILKHKRLFLSALLAVSGAASAATLNEWSTTGDRHELSVHRTTGSATLHIAAVKTPASHALQPAIPTQISHRVHKDDLPSWSEPVHATDHLKALPPAVMSVSAPQAASAASVLSGSNQLSAWFDYPVKALLNTMDFAVQQMLATERQIKLIPVQQTVWLFLTLVMVLLSVAKRRRKLHREFML
jgi:hypothetical protein